MTWGEHNNLSVLCLGKDNFFELLIEGVLYCFAFYSGGSIVAYSDSITEAYKKEQRKKKKIVVLGTGWAGISFLKDLDITSYDVQVVSPQNYFAFTPLLPSVTCGTVEARSIVESVRNITKKVLWISLSNFMYRHHHLLSL